MEKKNFMAPFYGWGSTASRLQSHYEEAVYFLLLSSQKELPTELHSFIHLFKNSESLQFVSIL